MLSKFLLIILLSINAPVFGEVRSASARETLLFVGSSTVANWQPMLGEQFPDFHAVAEGRGGTDYTWLIETAADAVRKHDPDRVVIYSGDNDLAAKHSPETVARNFLRTVQLIRAVKKDLPVYVLSIKPAPGRRELLGQVKAANALVKTTAAALRDVHYVDVYSAMFGPAGEINEVHFDPADAMHIHLSRRGYDLWTSILSAHLKRGKP